MYRPWHQRELDQKRKMRLVEKAQKAGVVDRLGEVQRGRGWNRRFAAVQKLRYEHATEASHA